MSKSLIDPRGVRSGTSEFVGIDEGLENISRIASLSLKASQGTFGGELIDILEESHQMGNGESDMPNSSSEASPTTPPVFTGFHSPLEPSHSQEPPLKNMPVIVPPTTIPVRANITNPEDGTEMPLPATRPKAQQIDMRAVERGREREFFERTNDGSPLSAFRVVRDLMFALYNDRSKMESDWEHLCGEFRTHLREEYGGIMPSPKKMIEKAPSRDEEEFVTKTKTLDDYLDQGPKVGEGLAQFSKGEMILMDIITEKWNSGYRFLNKSGRTIAWSIAKLDCRAEQMITVGRRHDHWSKIIEEPHKIPVRWLIHWVGKHVSKEYRANVGIEAMDRQTKKDLLKLMPATFEWA
ncbi:phosphoprotein [Frog lyssa-like virus 1]|uniref:Phosphoprotein n=1 Tax=Frog lyssa-like virus 1 TaxID=2571313 RepID=A0AAF1D5U2_9RHAB|nr:phosphoprotein [Frog lyssa-like virus 1]QCF24332.1 phosphoprotein [Frog lyssa-like virus 1]